VPRARVCVECARVPSARRLRGPRLSAAQGCHSPSVPEENGWQTGHGSGEGPLRAPRDLRGRLVVDHARRAMCVPCPNALVATRDGQGVFCPIC
jgi:hypothetical protein